MAAMRPGTKFVKVGDDHVAYQVIGAGALDVVLVTGTSSHVDVRWEDPYSAYFLHRLASYSRLILFDRRGTGASDPVRLDALPTWEDWAEDVLAVLDAAGSNDAAIVAWLDGGPMAMLFAAAHPERARVLVLANTSARYLVADDYPQGLAPERAEGLLQRMREQWGSEEFVSIAVPSKATDEAFRRWYARYNRAAARPSEAAAYTRAILEYDVRAILPLIRCPTLVLHRSSYPFIPVEQGRYVADHIPGARLIELPGTDGMLVTEEPDAVLEIIEAFLTGEGRPVTADRRLACFLCAEEPRAGAELGEWVWAELRARWTQMARTEVERHAGTFAPRANSGFIGIFDGPTRAIRCALSIAGRAEEMGLDVRIGLHSGECRIVGSEVIGPSLDAAAATAEAAQPGEILVSSTVRDLLPGSGFRFGESRTVQLAALGVREVQPLLREGPSPDAVRRLLSTQENVFRRDGEYWTLAYGGRVVALKDSKGLRDISELLRRPRREVHVFDLVTLSDPLPPDEAPGRDQPAVEVRRPNERAGEPVLDRRARAAYRERLQQVQDEVEQAERDRDPARASRGREELALLSSELSAAAGLGRRRDPRDPVERARKAVARRIREALDRVAREHPALGMHLSRSIRTGTFCSYAPESIPPWML